MKISVLLDELINIAKENGFSVRREKGSFRGGQCTLHEKRIIILNKHVPTEGLVAMLLRLLVELDIDVSNSKSAIQHMIEKEKILQQNTKKKSEPNQKE